MMGSPAERVWDLHLRFRKIDELKIGTLERTLAIALGCLKLLWSLSLLQTIVVSLSVCALKKVGSR